MWSPPWLPTRCLQRDGSKLTGIVTYVGEGNGKPLQRTAKTSLLILPAPSCAYSAMPCSQETTTEGQSPLKTNMQRALPSGCYGTVVPHSGLAAKHFRVVGVGVLDEDYRGSIGVVLSNFDKERFEVKKGDQTAQLICEQIFYPEIEDVQILDNTERDSGGFGSTGKKTYAKNRK
uniref:Deoxyuridine 5'-triphosphate nucleotidohydrolase n=1 Tax=Moschus moschiferus TaxID=68415 RepID=A0A8C6DRJ3_MOSMO